MHSSQNKKKLQLLLLVLVAILTLSIGYASISALNFIINGNGTVSVSNENFKVYFTNSIITEGKGTVSIDEEDATIGYFDVTGLSKEGDEATATYTVLNDSNGVGADISLQLTNSNNEYFKVTTTVVDDTLQAGEETDVRVKVEMIKTPIESAVSTSISATLVASPLEDAEATGGSPASKVEPTPFASDSWTTIKTNVQNGNISQYNIGDTKIVSINNTNYTVRLVNKSVNANCSNANYSETACGFVVEFADIITLMKMRDSGTNVGGYPTTLVYDYLKNTLYGNLPQELQSAIKPTRVISGYGNNGTDSANFITTDNLYLLSGVEVHGLDEYDTSASTTTQLEYYVDMPSEEYDPCSGCGVINHRYPKSIKHYISYNMGWWLRSAFSSKTSSYCEISSDGSLYKYAEHATNTSGVSPAFRIG